MQPPRANLLPKKLKLPLKKLLPRLRAKIKPQPKKRTTMKTRIWTTLKELTPTMICDSHS
tara:strand:+ start:433 stop:612 length:180 start_codon:yes stop_codon:yes gene_type:complete